MLDSLTRLTKIPKEIIDSQIRKKALANAKERLMFEQLTPEELGADAFEVIVHEEIEKINAQIKDMSILPLIAFLGLELVLG